MYSIKVSYLEAVKNKRRSDSDDEVTSLPLKKRGRPLLLGVDLETKVQMYLKKIREGAASIVMAATRGILLRTDRSKLAEFRGHIGTGHTTYWIVCILFEEKSLRQKASTHQWTSLS